jgi:hypothetical protein
VSWNWNKPDNLFLQSMTWITTFSCKLWIENWKSPTICFFNQWPKFLLSLLNCELKLKKPNNLFLLVDWNWKNPTIQIPVDVFWLSKNLHWWWWWGWWSINCFYLEMRGNPRPNTQTTCMKVMGNEWAFKSWQKQNQTKPKGH